MIWISSRNSNLNGNPIRVLRAHGKYPVLSDGVPYNVKGNIYAGRIATMGVKAIETLENLLSALENALEEDLQNNSELCS